MVSASLQERQRSARQRAAIGAVLLVACVACTVASVLYIRSLATGFDNDVLACRGRGGSDLVAMIVPGRSAEERATDAGCAEGLRSHYRPLRYALPPDYASASLVAQLLGFIFACVAVGATVVGPITFGMPAAIGLIRARRASARERLQLLRGVANRNELVVAVTVDLVPRSDLQQPVQQLVSQLIDSRFSDLPGSRARRCRPSLVARRLRRRRWDDATLTRLAGVLNCEAPPQSAFARRGEVRRIARVVARQLSGLAAEANALHV